MPALLTLLGLIVAGLLLPRIRPALLGALVAGGVVVAATPAISPPTYAKLVLHFRAQMADFADSPYGLLFTRAAVMTEDHPLFGLGFRGFRLNCRDLRYNAAIPWLGLADTANASPEKCNQHPHNFYLEAATEAGLPGLAAFGAMVLVWLLALGQNLIPARGAGAPPLRVALFVTVLMALWPLASTSEFFSVPNCGWLFLILGWGVAEARANNGP